MTRRPSVDPAALVRWGRKTLIARLGLRPFFVNLEVTKRCNARCKFCHYWTLKEETSLADYAPVIRHIDPVAVNITGGEPLLRQDICRIISGLKQAVPLLRVAMISNGWLLTEDLARRLETAGLDQLSISLDFPDDRHDALRGIPGLFEHIDALIPQLRRRRFQLGINSVLFQDNLEEAAELVRWAAVHGIGVGFSCYSSLKTGQTRFSVDGRDRNRVTQALEGLIALKRRYGNVNNSIYYLRRAQSYFLTGRVTGCQAGRRWLQITPDGYIKRCSEKPVRCSWSRFAPGRTFAPTACDRCWFACRGESEAPVQPARLRKYLALLIPKGRL